jgi:hypothetical protein
VLFVAGTAPAVGNNAGTPYKWVQLPDLSPLGIDVDSTNPGMLADDFLCTTTGYITGFHIWGSWLNDFLPYGYDANDVAFNLSIYSDIPDPDGTGAGYSTPGQQLWEHFFLPSEFTVQQDTALEDWYNPITGEYLPNNHTGVWQYNLVAPTDGNPVALFYQEEGTVYWVGIEVFPGDTSATFGWKTSLDHWNDDAVFWLEPGSWHELRYPDGHELQGQSIDLAFGIIPEPVTIALLGLGSLGLLRRRKNS